MALASQVSEVRRHLSVYGLGRILNILSQFAIVAILSRIDSTLYLEYTLVAGAILTSSNLFFGWVRQSLLRVSRDAPAAGSWAPQPVLLAFFLASGCLSAVFAALLVPSVRSLDILGAVWAAGGCYCLGQYFVTVAQATLLPGRAVVLESVRLAMTGFLPLGLHLVGISISLELVVWLVAISNAFPALICIRGIEAGGRLGVDDFVFGFPVAVWLMLSAALIYSDRWILSARASSEAAAAYAVTYDVVAKGTGAVLAPLITALHPLIMKASNSGRHGVALSLVRKAGIYQATLLGPLILGGIVFAVWGGRLFPAANTDLRVVLVLIASGFLWQFALIAHKPYELAGRTLSMIGALCVALVLGASISWATAPFGGATAVGLANVAAALTYLAVLGAMWRFRHG